MIYVYGHTLYEYYYQKLLIWSFQQKTFLLFTEREERRLLFLDWKIPKRCSFYYWTFKANKFKRQTDIKVSCHWKCHSAEHHLTSSAATYLENWQNKIGTNKLILWHVNTCHLASLPAWLLRHWFDVSVVIDSVSSVTR